MRKEESVIKYFTQKELKKIFSAIEKTKDKGNPYYLRDKCIFEISYLCGLRASEVGMLKLENFNQQTSELYVRRLKGSTNTTTRLDKQRKNLLELYIRKYKIKAPEEFLFTTRNNRPFSGVTITFLVEKYMKGIKGIPKEKLKFHSIKHSICVHLAESGADLKEIKNYVGHKRIESTLCYFSFTTKQQDAFYEKISKNSKLV